MPEFQIDFQKNSHPRDLIYELSTTYLVSRSIHLAAKLRITSQLRTEGITRTELISYFRDYESSAISMLVDILVAYRIIDIKEDNNCYPTPLSTTINTCAATLALDEAEWCESYDILAYLTNHPFESTRISIVVNNNCLSLCSSSSEALIYELAHLHYLTRAMRLATAVGIFELYQPNEQLVLLPNEYLIYLPILKLLSRYQLLTLDLSEKKVRFSCHCQYLVKNDPESLYYAMFMIDKPWWKAAAYLEQSFKKNSLSAFEFINHASFYQVYTQEEHCFAHGMAAISVREDEDVAQASHPSLLPYKTIIDIGGGEGGLLVKFRHYLGNSKEYILFEKSPPKFSSLMNAAASTVKVILGDFLQPRETNNIPKFANAAYFIKCVLHNMQKKEAITLLKNVRLAMKENCQLFIAERVIPENDHKPHANLACNLLMHMLFRAETHDILFYQEILETAGFALNHTCAAGNYRVFVASEKPELFFQKSFSTLRTTILSPTSKTNNDSTFLNSTTPLTAKM